MDDLFINIWLVAAIFSIVAFLYSAVGLAGGSSYIALLTIFGANYLIIPTISLSLNILVSSLGTWNYIRGKHARANLIIPFLLPSIPFAWLGGSVQLPAHFFHILLFIFLGIVAIRIYCFSQLKTHIHLTNTARFFVSLAIGAGLGFVSGALGLGGGIYLVPLIVLLGMGGEKEAAASGSIFIWVNSLAGLFARLGNHPTPSLGNLAPIIICVAVGGYLGSFLGANVYSARNMQRILGIIILVAMGFLIPKIFV